MSIKKNLTVDSLCKEAERYAKILSQKGISDIFGVTDGKAIGTYIEHNFQKYLHNEYLYVEGNTARGIDFPELNVDMKVTLIRQPQSSCPFKSAEQKIYGLGYSLLVFVYDKSDDHTSRTGRLDFKHIIFVDETKTADFQTTTGITKLIENDANTDDLIAFMFEKHLPVDEIQATKIAERLVEIRPEIGYLTISNALQWRLQYKRVIDTAGSVVGVKRIL